MISWPRTYLWRLGLALILTQFVVAGGMAVYAYLAVKSFHYDRTLESLQRIGPLYATRYEQWLLDHRDGQATLDVAQAAAESDLRLTIVLADGRVVADSHGSPKSMDNHRFRPEIDDAFTHGEGVATRFSNTVGRTMMYVARRVDDANGQAVGVVRSAFPLTQIDASYLGVVQAIVLALMISLAVTIAAVYVISRHFGGLIGRLAHDASRIARGNLEHRLTPPHESELYVLADSINTMADEVAARIRLTEHQQRQGEAILQAMGSAVLALDSEQRITTMNHAAERMLGTVFINADGRLIQEVAREPALLEFIAAAFEADAIIGHTEEFTLSGDPPVTVRAVGESLPQQDGKSTGLLVLLEDVTRMRRLEKLRSDFAANVSHELRTPITSLKGYIDTLLEVGADDRQQVDRFLQIIKHNSDRLSAIVDDVMALTQLERPGARTTLQREVVRVADIFAGVMRQFESQADSRNMRLVVDCDPDLTSFVHPRLIEQAIGNLVSNAINYGPAGTTVTLAASVTPSQLSLSVTDEGPGISPEHQSRLFERFYRADNARSRELGGTGLGLAIVKHIALIHGGSVELVSERGSGSRFTMVLPQLDADEASFNPAEVAGPSSAGND